MLYLICDRFETPFWHDVWFGDLSLKDDFLELFRISHFKDAYVVDHCQLRHDSIRWCVNFVREANDWEVDLFKSFFDWLYLPRAVAMVKLNDVGPI